MIQSRKRSSRGRPPVPKVSHRVYEAVKGAVEKALRERQLTISKWAERTCNKCRTTVLDVNGQRHVVPYCRHDPFPFRGRSWLIRALWGHKADLPYMSHEHARCIVWRGEQLGAFSSAQVHRLSLLISQDEPPPVPATLAVYPGSSDATVAELVRIAIEAVPSLGKGTEKRRALELSLKRYLSARELEAPDLWAHYFKAMYR